MVVAPISYQLFTPVNPTSHLLRLHFSTISCQPCFPAFSTPVVHNSRLRLKLRRQLTSSVTALPLSMFSENPFVGDIVATVLSGGIALSILRFWEETTKRDIFDQRLNRKLVHISIGLAFMLCWPMFSSGRCGALVAALIPGVNVVKMLLLGLGILKDEATVKSMSRFGDHSSGHRGAILAALISGVNVIKMLLLGLGILKDEATVKSMSRFGDHRELLKGPLYYAATITLACAIFWRYSPIAIAVICNLCAGDGLADIVGRWFGSQKLPYNRNKSIAGSVAMAIAGFLASIGYMHYFSSFGYMRQSWEMVLGFLAVSLATTLAESHPLSTELDDNLTVPLTAWLVGILVF